MTDVLKIHDATIGEGERVPGCAMNPDEKLRIARQIERLRVSSIDAGEPMASPEDFEAVRRIAAGIEQCAVSARCLPIPGTHRPGMGGVAERPFAAALSDRRYSGTTFAGGEGTDAQIPGRGGCPCLHALL